MALGWPATAAGADGVILYLVGASTPDPEILSALRKTLPGYMLPTEINHVDRFPLSSSGKVDRRRLLAEREERALAALPSAVGASAGTAQ